MGEASAMKIAMVSPYDWCSEGGVKTHIRQLAARFRRWGHEVVIFAPASEPAMVADEVTVMGRPWSIPASGSVARITFSWLSSAVEDALERHRFDVVHLHEPLMPLLPYHFLQHSQAANIGTFHAARDGGSLLYWYTRPLTRRWFRRLEGKIAVSPAAAALISRYFRGYYNIIPNGIDLEFWGRPYDPIPELLDGKLNILFVGRPEKRKGLRYLLRAFAELRAVRGDVRLVVVGAGDFRRYRKLMAGVPDVLFAEYVPHEELPRYHSSAHVFCAPNTGNESQGYVILEALAAGLPVVASNIPGFAGVISDGVDGILVPPKDHRALAAALNELLNAPERRRELREAARRRARAFSWEQVAARVLDYYLRLLDERAIVERTRAAMQARPSLR